MTDFTNRIPLDAESLEPRSAASGDADADGVSDVEELLAGTDPNDPNNFPGPVLDVGLPPLGTTAIAGVEPIEAVLVDPAVEVATSTPTGAAIGSTLDGATIGGIGIDLAPSHLGVDLEVGGLTPTSPIVDALGFGSTAGVTVTPATSGTGTLGPLPGMGLVAADGDGETTSADADGNIVTTKIATTENDKGTTKTTEKTTEGSTTKVVETTIQSTENDGDVVTITKTETYKLSPDGAQWVKDTATVSAAGTNNGQPFEWKRETYPTKTYDTGEGDDALPAELSAIVTQMVTTGVDPTTTTPGGPLVDDGGGEPVDADDVSGVVTALGVAVKPGVIDGGFEVEVVGDGDPSTGLIVGGPDVVDPHDPTVGGAGEPISAGDLRDPQPSTANPTSSTSSAMRIEGGVAGGEDEDLDDLETSSATAGTSPSTWAPVGEAGTVGTIHEVADAETTVEPVMVDVPIRVVEASLGGPVLDPVVGTAPVVGDPSGLPGIEPEVPVATALPGGLPVDAGLEDLSIGGLQIDTAPSHYGIDTSAGEATPSTIAAILDIDGVTATATPVPAGTAGTGTLGPLPGSSLYADSDEGGEGDAAGGQQPKPWVDPATTPKPEEPGLWETFKRWIDPAGGTTTTPDAGTPSTNPKQPLKPYPGDKYDNPDATPVLVEPSDIVTQIVTTGVDPTTTTPSGPYVDDGGAAPITSDAVAGAGPVGGLHVPLNPLVVDDTGDDLGIVGTGDPGVRIVVEGPDVIGPSAPVLGGAEPITAGDLTPRPGAANPIAGGEDEDLEDLEIQRLTPGSNPTPTTGATDGSTTTQDFQPMTAALAPVEPVLAPVVPMARGRGIERGVDRAGHGGRGHDDDGGFDIEPVVVPEVEAPVLDTTHGDPIELFGDDVTDGDMAPADDGTDWDGDG